jgi:hypothetical protein
VKFTTAVQTTTGAVNADIVAYDPPFTGGAATNVEAKLAQYVTIEDFGASPFASAAVNDAAIAAAVAYTNTLDRPKLVVPAGIFTISATAVFDLPNGSTIEFIGSFSTSTTGCAVQIGSASTNRINYRVVGIKVARSSVDTSAGSIGVQLRNLAICYVDVRAVTGFQTGVHVFADKPNGGVSYCEVHLGQLHDNRTNLHLEADGTAGGYVNENSFYGGSFNHSSTYPAVSTINLHIDYDGVYLNNNNRFFAPSLEDNSTLAVAAIINGANHLIFHPRIERTASQATYKIQLTANSSECQITGNGFFTQSSNIEDLGSDNSYQTRSGTIYTSQAGAGAAVISARSSASANARVFEARDTSNVARGWILANGQMYSAQDGYFETGIRWATSSGTLQDRGLFSANGSPEGVITAATGSMYLNRNGGAGTTLYVKETGSGNTGWVAK